MFGLIHALVTLTGAAISGTKGMLQNEENRSRGRQRDIGQEVKRNTYYDRKGVERSLTNNSIITTTRDYLTGDTVQKNSYGDIVRNLSEEQRALDFSRAQNNHNGKTTFLYKKRAVTLQMILDRDYKGIRAIGDQYKDYKTGELYQCRWIPIGEWVTPYDKSRGFNLFEKGTWYLKNKGVKVKFYTNHGFIIRLADSEVAERRKYIDAGLKDELIPEEKINEFIKRFNAAQRENGWFEGGRLKYGETNLVTIQDVSNKFYLNDFDMLDTDSNYTDLAIQGLLEKRKEKK